MTVPPYQDMMLPMLRLIESGHETIGLCLEPLIAEFLITEDEAQSLLPSGKQTYLSNRAHWARQYLSQAGLVEASKRGHYQITKLGKDLLLTSPPKIDATTLRAYPLFQQFQQRSARSTDEASGDAGKVTVSDHRETPDALIAKAHAEIEASLVSDLLSAILSVSPTMFEQLIVDLLLAMGYGGGDKSMGERIGKSGDGGIDGVINEDKLGLDAVYVQAKRYAPDSKVGRPALQAFVGSLTGEGANKGVFVTTSDFSKDARDYLNRVQHRIVLINDERLAQLMIQYEVGVRARKSYVIRSIDEDYFVDLNGG